MYSDRVCVHCVVCVKKERNQVAQRIGRCEMYKDMYEKAMRDCSRNDQRAQAIGLAMIADAVINGFRQLSGATSHTTPPEDADAGGLNIVVHQLDGFKNTDELVEQAEKHAERQYANEEMKVRNGLPVRDEMMAEYYIKHLVKAIRELQGKK